MLMFMSMLMFKHKITNIMNMFMFKRLCIDTCIVVTACIAVHYMLVPTMWWCIIDDVMRGTGPKKANVGTVLVRLAPLVLCPKVIAMLWAAEIISYLSFINMDILNNNKEHSDNSNNIPWSALASSASVNALATLGSSLIRGRACFSWAHACRIPSLMGTRSWHIGLKTRVIKIKRYDKKLEQSYSYSYACVTLLILAHYYLVVCATTWRGVVGILCWSISLVKTKQRTKKLKFS